MKTTILTIIIAVISFSSYSIDDPKKESTEKCISQKKTDSSEVEELKFDIHVLKEESKVLVHLNGNFDRYSSVSIINNRGSEYSFSFVQNGWNEIEFNTSNLEPGSYFIMLNTDSEIRMKHFQKL
jgi:hypothetical protein